MKERIRILWRKYKTVLLYLIFGGFTTLVNIGIYAFCYKIAGFSNVLSNILAWIGAVTFAFLTNKFWVFGSRTNTVNGWLKEVVSFFGCRLVTGVIDVTLMYLLVDIGKMPSIGTKVLVNVVVIVLNYIASKIWIFKKREV